MANILNHIMLRVDTTSFHFMSFHVYIILSTQVMLVKSTQPSRGLVNGARGVVVRFHRDTHWPVVRFAHLLDSGNDDDSAGECPAVVCESRSSCMIFIALRHDVSFESMCLPFCFVFFLCWVRLSF